jgi:hypothetical protein
MVRQLTICIFKGNGVIRNTMTTTLGRRSSWTIINGRAVRLVLWISIWIGRMCACRIGQDVLLRRRFDGALDEPITEYWQARCSLEQTCIESLISHEFIRLTRYKTQARTTTTRDLTVISALPALRLGCEAARIRRKCCAAKPCGLKDETNEASEVVSNPDTRILYVN